MEANIYRLWNESTGTYRKISLPYTFQTLESYRTSDGAVRDRITFILDGYYNSKTNRFEFTVTRKIEIVNTGTPSVKSWKIETKVGGSTVALMNGQISTSSTDVIVNTNRSCNADTSLTSLVLGNDYVMTYQDNTTTSGSSTSTYKLERFTNINRKINSSWKKCIPWKRISGGWKRCKVFMRINGTWKEGK